MKPAKPAKKPRFAFPAFAERAFGTSPSRGKGCTSKALVVGLIGVVCLDFGSTYNDMLIKGSHLALWNLTPAATFLAFVLTAVVNVLLGLIHRPLALQRGELAVAYFLMLVGNTVAGWGFSGYILPVITGAYYYATPENNWREVVQPFLPDWAGPQGQDVIWHFYEGNPAQGVPWEAWLLPLTGWFGFALALFLVMVCTMVIVRRQWVEHERLPYPMVQLPLAMIADDERGSLIKPLFRSKLMWLGFAFPCGAGTINALHNYFGVFSPITLSLNIQILRDTANIGVHVNSSIVGISYFIHQNVALGLVFFHLVNQVQQGVLAVLGVQGREEALGAFTYTDPLILHQAMGGMIVLVLGVLWAGRDHLRAVARKAFLGDPTVDDSDEILSYRAAVFCTLGGILVMGVWLWRTGMPLLSVSMLLFGAFVVFLTITREAAQGGVATMFAPLRPPDFVISGMGGSLLGAKGLAGLALSYAWGIGMLTLLMAACANGLKLITEVNISHRRSLFGGIVAAIVLTLGVCIGLILYLAYHYGGINLDQWLFNNLPRYPYEFMARNIYDPTGPNLSGWIHTGVGAAVMAGLMLAQNRFLWWPFHPLGFPISCVFDRMWFSVFVAWLIKGVVLKYGGPAIYNRMKPIFLGLILGEAVVGTVWVIIDYFTGKINNHLGGVVF